MTWKEDILSGVATKAADIRTAAVLSSILVIVMNVFAVGAHSQNISQESLPPPTQRSESFAGCYQVSYLSWSPTPVDNNLNLPSGFELSAEPLSQGAPYFKLRSLSKSARGAQENFWYWKPLAPDKLKIDFLGSGLGGIRGTLTRSRKGELVGKVKEWCDYRCAKKTVGKLDLRRVSCGQE